MKGEVTPTIIELVQLEAPPNARMSLLVNGEPCESAEFQIGHTIDTEFAGVWLDGERLYDTEVWYVALDGERWRSVYVPPQSEAVDYSYDQLEETHHGPR